MIVEHRSTPIIQPRNAKTGQESIGTLLVARRPLRRCPLSRHHTPASMCWAKPIKNRQNLALDTLLPVCQYVGIMRGIQNQLSVTRATSLNRRGLRTILQCIASAFVVCALQAHAQALVTDDGFS